MKWILLYFLFVSPVSAQEAGVSNQELDCLSKVELLNDQFYDEWINYLNGESSIRPDIVGRITTINKMKAECNKQDTEKPSPT